MYLERIHSREPTTGLVVYKWYLVLWIHVTSYKPYFLKETGGEMWLGLKWKSSDASRQGLGSRNEVCSCSWTLWVNAPEGCVTTKVPVNGQGEGKEGRRRYLKETELDKLTFPLLLPKWTDLTKNNFSLHALKCNYFFKSFRSRKLNSTLFNDTFPQRTPYWMGNVLPGSMHHSSGLERA